MEEARGWRVADGTSAAALARRWRQRWPASRPIGHELRHGEAERWVRFHGLPQSKRYPDTEEEHAEIRRRHHALLSDLLRSALGGAVDPDTPLLLITCSWSLRPRPAPREPHLALFVPARRWVSVLRERDGREECWNHLWVTPARLASPMLDHLLRMVADDRTADVIIAPPDLAWLYHPYDGGADVIAATTAVRDLLRLQHQEWLPVGPDGL